MLVTVFLSLLRYGITGANMRILPVALFLAVCSSQALPAPIEEAADAPSQPEGVVRFSFAVNGLEHGNGAL